MTRRVIGIVLMPIVYFGLVLLTAMLVANKVISEIPLWSPPVFSTLAVLGAIASGKVRLIDVIVVFAVSVLIFPLGLFYLMGISAGLAPHKSLSTIVSAVTVSEWIGILSPLIAAIIAYFVIEKFMKPRV